MNLYFVEIENGITHPEYGAFHKAMSNMNAKHPDYSSSMNRRLVRHPLDEKTVKTIITAEMEKDDDVTVSKVTDEQLEGILSGYRDLIERYYMPYDKYPDISL